jgi:hypothetical protein
VGPELTDLFLFPAKEAGFPLVPLWFDQPMYPARACGCCAFTALFGGAVAKDRPGAVRVGENTLHFIVLGALWDFFNRSRLGVAASLIFGRMGVYLIPPAQHAGMCDFLLLGIPSECGRPHATCNRKAASVCPAMTKYLTVVTLCSAILVLVRSATI